MSRAWHMLPWIAGTIAAVVGFAVSGPIVAVGLGLGVLAVSGLIIGGLGSRAEVRSDPLGDLEPNLRQRLRPLTKVEGDIRELIATNVDNPVVSVMSLEIESEIRGVIRHAVQLVQERQRLRKLLFSTPRASSAIEDLEKKLRGDLAEDVRAALEASLAARRSEFENYESVETEIQRVEATIDTAESVLSQVKSRVVMAVAAQSADRSALEEQQLVELTERLRTINKTMEQSVEAIRTQSQ